MTYAGQSLKRLTLFILFAVFMYWLGKGEGGRAAVFFFFFALFFLASNYLQRSVGEALSSHLGTESCIRGWLWWYLYSPSLWLLPVEMQSYAEMASLSFLVFVILSLAPQIQFFPFVYCQRCFSSELYYPVTSEEAKLHVSAWQESST